MSNGKQSPEQRLKVLNKAVEMFGEDVGFEIYEDYYGRFGVHADGLVIHDSSPIDVGAALCLAHMVLEECVGEDEAYDIFHGMTQESNILPDRSDNMGLGTIYY